ncbi:MAG TPA: haloacid dehalogenase-like hydrolase [Archangium sp.]|uniref:HAD family hydrolase n=1 Tax=Archangium sp. TaxID=1872627 RepID=UPI002E368342|nr:haloacid dehalogenase-like hydrolase [Archangium sp.]HEX5751133.1 haloacid dehalogenase-like hydrolase [Archangium sp.]
MSNELKAAVLDVDGTLYPGALGVELLRALMAAGVCHRTRAEGVFEVLRQYKQGLIDFSTMASRAYPLYAQALEGARCDTVDALARKVWEQERHKLFGFVRPLVGLLREAGYWSVIISGSPQEMIQCVADELGISQACGALFTRREGHYTGAVDLSSGALGEKRRIFDAVTRGQDVRLERCFALGDSITDSALFERLGLPLAFEPEPALRVLAQRRGWAVATREDVLERARMLLAAPAPESPPRG